MKITKIQAAEVLDSRGNPTVLCEVWAGDSYGRAIVPSGASTGEYEALELRDGDKSRFLGKGVLKAVANVNKIIAPVLCGQFEVSAQSEIDDFMIKLDGTESKNRLGANAVLGVSLACAYAAADEKGVPVYVYIKDLYKKMTGNDKPPAKGRIPAINAGKEVFPMPMMNVINGGAHADNNLDIQEFMIMPVGAKTMFDAVRMGAEVFHNLKKVLKSKGLSTSVGDEGGFAPNLKTNREALELISAAVKEAGYKPGKDFMFALDAAASEFYNRETKKYDIDGQKLGTRELIDYYSGLCKDFPVISIEDGLDQDDWDGYAEFTKLLGTKIQIVGDDFFVTNVKRLERGIKLSACNSILIKPNQIGSLTETLDCIKTAHEAGYSTVISHRSGETEDTTIADLAVAVAAGQIKTGSLSRTDRVCKYNRLIMIEKSVK